MKKQLIILASPSGGGKSTVARHLLNKYSDIRFSISATTRAIRKGETNGREYYFFTKDEFKKRINNNEFVEYEEIFGNYYGTLKTEIEEAIKKDKLLIFDIDVKGALSLKKLFPQHSLLIFIAPPSMEELEQRLRARSTETEEEIRTRLSRAEMEMSLLDEFDYIITNNILQDTFEEAEKIVEKECL